jgi:hypothetical protein
MTWSAVVSFKKQHDVIDFTFMPLLKYLALSISQPVSRRTHKANAILEHIHDYYIVCTADING